MVTIEISKSAQPRDSSIPGYVDPGRVYLSTSASGDVVDLWTEVTVSGNQKWSLHGPGMRPHDYDTDSQFTQIKSAGQPNVGCDGDSCSNYLKMQTWDAGVRLAPQWCGKPAPEKNCGEPRFWSRKMELHPNSDPDWTGTHLDWAIVPTGKNDDDGEPLWWIQTKRCEWCDFGMGWGKCTFAKQGRVWLSTTSNGDNVDLWSDNEKDNNQMWRITCLEDAPPQPPAAPPPPPAPPPPAAPPPPPAPPLLPAPPSC